LVGCTADLASRDYWPQWGSIQRPALVILGEHGLFNARHGEEMVSQLRGASLAIIDGAGHDVHLEQPGRWVRALESFTRSRT
jgi:pimeloyl-ACP methyl ester carboxylesterase